jgi:hypothetical protein
MQRYTSFKNIYSLGSAFIASINADVFETDVKGSIARAQFFPYYHLSPHPRATINK